jgi:hypothetical protein
MYKTDNMILEELKEKCIGNVYDDDMYDIIIDTFDSENCVYINKSSNSGYDLIAYEDKPNSTCFCFEMNKKSIITDIWI